MSFIKENIQLKKNLEPIIVGLSACLLAGIFYSKAVTTICTIGLFVVALRFITFEKIKDFFKDKKMMPFLFVFLASFLSGSYSDNQELWQTALRVKLPFLVLPFAFFLLPKIKEQLVIQLHYWLIVVVVVVSLPVLTHALLNYDSMIDLLSKGQAIPTPIEHVKYSMFNAYAAIAGLFLIRKEDQLSSTLKVMLIIAVVFIIFMLHFLAVRTGLVIFYLSLFGYCIVELIKGASGKKTLIVFIVAIALPIITLKLSPTLQQKMGYMNHDWLQYKKDVGHQYSDSERIMSYKAALHMIGSNPLIGVGYGDVLEEAHVYYDQTYKRQDLFKLPHSQYLLTLAGSGLLGFIIFMVGFFTPLLSKKLKTKTGTLLLLLYLNYSISFLVENSLERSVSVAFFLLFALLLLKAE